MFRTDIYGLPPGLTGASETYEAAFRWGQFAQGVITGVIIDGGAIDPTNTPTYELRAGLVLGRKSTTGTWTNYGATNTDGSGIAAGVLLSAVRMQDFQGNNQQRFFGILVGGPVQAAKLLGLNYMARQQMTGSGAFQFDDDTVGFGWFPYKQMKTITTSYVAVATENMTEFNNAGATGTVTVTLPAIQPGLMFAIRVVADQTMAIASAEGTNIVALNNASASSLTFSTSSQKIGGGMRVYSNPAGTKWYAENASAGTNAVTVA